MSLPEQAGVLETTTETPEISSFLSTTHVLAFLAVTMVAYYWYTKVNEDDWTRYGVKYPKLSWQFLFAEDFRKTFALLLDQYGDTVGFRAAGKMFLLSSNFDLLKKILIKDFNNFVDRGDKIWSNSPLEKSLFFAKSQAWRRSRQIVSPTFTTGKLKHIAPQVDKSAIDLAAHLEQIAKDGKLVPLKDICAKYTCEVIAKTAFGLNAKFTGRPESECEFFGYAQNLIFFQREGLTKLIFRLVDMYSWVSDLFRKVSSSQHFDFVNIKASKYFENVLTSTIAERRKQENSGLGKSSIDFLDLILKANDAAKKGHLEAIDENNESVENVEGVAKGLSDEEVLGHSMLVIFAGMETTATTLQMCLYELSRHPDIQEKVYHELQANLGSDESPTPEKLKQLTYTEQVLNETLRMYPPVVLLTRETKETRTYGSITIPKDAVVLIPVAYICRDPNIFPNPDKFDPDRFSAEEKEKRDPMSFLVFGNGPRVCLGMRLAYLELKEALAHIIRKVKVSVNEDTEPKRGTDVKLAPGTLIVPTKPIQLAFELRENSKKE